jgi:hypothetical protein
MSFTPTGVVRLINNVPFTPDYQNVIDFADATAQQNYFYNKLYAQIDGVTYIRAKQQIHVNYNLEDLYGVNYVVYQNKNKWIYAFITEKEYKNDNNTLLTIAVDVFQTFMFDYTIKSAYVEREHNSRNTIPKIDEGFDLGNDYQVYNRQTVFNKGNYWLMIFSSVKARKPVQNGKKDLDGNIIEYIEMDKGKSSTAINAPSINGVPYPFYVAVSSTSALRTIMETLKGCNSIVSIVKSPMSPSIPQTSYITVPYYNELLVEGSLTVNVLDGVQDTDIQTLGTFAMSFDIPSVGSSFNPLAENRFRYYPYCYSMLTDYMSDPLILKHEFLSGTVVKGAFTYTHEPSQRYWVEGYLGDTGGNVHNITNNVVESLPLANDNGAMMLLSQQNSMRQNFTNMKNDAIIGAVNNVARGASDLVKDPLIGGMEIVMGVANQAYNFERSMNNELARQQDIISQPQSIKTMGKIGSGVGFDVNKVDVVSYKISDEVKRRIGSYWHYFGYKTLEVKNPNLRSRADFNYIKCGDITFDSGIDGMFMQQLKNIYTQGVRIWHNPLTYLDYNVANVEV